MGSLKVHDGTFNTVGHICTELTQASFSCHLDPPADVQFLCYSSGGISVAG